MFLNPNAEAFSYSEALGQNATPLHQLFNHKPKKESAIAIFSKDMILRGFHSFVHSKLPKPCMLQTRQKNINIASRYYYISKTNSERVSDFGAELK